MSTRSPQDQDKYVVRFPEGMRDTLKQEAQKSGRTLNSEIVYRLMITLGEGAEGPEVTLHIPEDLQNRIARAATRHHNTVNEEVLNILYEHFPEPKTPETAAYEIKHALEAIEPARSIEAVDALVRQLEQFAYEITKNRIPVSAEIRENVAEAYERYSEERLEDFSRPPIGEDE